MMDATELLKKVRRIEIRTRHVVNEALAGQYHTVFRGRGMEFEEVRPYQLGDDVRTIDWNVSARFGEPFVKVFREERELTVMLMVDLSRSQWVGTRGQMKRELTAELGAMLAFSAITNNDKVGLLGFTDEVEKVVPARKGKSHVLRVVRELLAYESKGIATDVGEALMYLHRVMRRKCVVFIISDFQCGDFLKELRLARRRHDVILVNVTDPVELAMPAVGLVRLRDNETGHVALVDTSSKRWRAKYAQHSAERQRRLERIARQAKADCVEIKTGEDFVIPLEKFFRAREGRR
ncbi:MAG TPA: DUF58 domain-containing protein [Phycisphaerales bacterium]|nr:DUF58 domain-containing protein [Phycisphaerales bacterium]